MKNNILPQTHTDGRGHFIPATCGNERIIASRKRLCGGFPPKGSIFCLASVGQAKSLCMSRERSERAANKPCPNGSKATHSLLGVSPIPAPQGSDSLLLIQVAFNLKTTEIFSNNLGIIYFSISKIILVC